MILENGLHSIQGEKFSVDCECLEIVHIVYIAPDCVQRNVVFLEFGDDGFESGDVLVSPAALMVPKDQKGGMCELPIKLWKFLSSSSGSFSPTINLKSMIPPITRKICM